MKAIKRILVGLLVLILILALVGLALPSRAHVERSISIAATPATVFELVNGFKRFNEWSPWYDYDPAARYTYSGPEQGVGARLEWKSDKPEVGSGSQQIVASEPDQRVRYQLDFGDQGTAESEISIAPSEAGSQVRWSFDTEFGYNLPMRYFGLLFDRLIGADYEKGLARLKALAEADAAQPAPGAKLEITLEEVPAVDLASVEGTVSLDPTAIAQTLGGAYEQIGAFMKNHGLRQDGARLAINRFYDESGWGFEAAIPIAGSPAAKAKAAASGGLVKLGQGYSGQAVKGTHIGPYADLPDTYRQLEDYVAENGLESNGRSWEQYVSEPGKIPQEELRTDVYLPVKAVQ